jgi:hypothetical protein
MLIQFSFVMIGLRNQCCSLRHCKLVSEIFADNDLRVKYFDKNNIMQPSCDSVSGMQEVTQNIDT